MESLAIAQDTLFGSDGVSRGIQNDRMLSKIEGRHTGNNFWGLECWNLFASCSGSCPGIRVVVIFLRPAMTISFWCFDHTCVIIQNKFYLTTGLREGIF